MKWGRQLCFDGLMVKIIAFSDEGHGTMGDRSLIVPVEVQKIIPTPSRVSWISRDQKLSVKHRYIGFMLILSVFFV